MLKILLIITSFAILTPAQSVTELYDRGIDAYNNKEYVLANSLFEQFFTGYKLQDELYSNAKYYSSDALLNLGNKDAAAVSFEYLVYNFRSSNFRDLALYKLGLIYFEKQQYFKSRQNFQKLLDDHPSSDYAGSALYWIGESYSVEGRLDDAVNFLKGAADNKNNKSYADYSLFTLASVYEKKGDYENAVKYYDELLSYHKNSPLAAEAQIRIGICYFKLKDYQSSILELNSPLLDSLSEETYSESLYLLANSYYRVNDFQNAERTYLEIIKTFPGTGYLKEAQYGLAWTYFQEGKYRDAYNIFNSLSEGDDSLAVKSFYWKGEAKRYGGQESEAFKIFKDFLKKYPTDKLAAGVRYQMGVLYYNKNNLSEAEKFLGETIGSAENDIAGKAFNLSGEIKLSKNQYAAAKDDYQKVLSLDNVDGDTRNRAVLGLGASLYYLGEFPQGVEQLKKLSQDYPEFERDKVNFYLAENYFASGDYSNAIKRYDSVDVNSELYNSVLYGKGYSYFNLKQYESASYQFSDFLKKYPQDSRVNDARLRLADSYYGNKNFDAAGKIYKEMFSIDNETLNNPYAYYQYAQALYKGGAVQEALNEFNNLQTRFPESEYADESLYIIGWIHFQQGNFNESIQRYRNVLTNYPNTTLRPVILYSIGDAYFNMAQYDSAIANYQRVLDYYPGSQNVFDAVNGIQYSYIAKGDPDKAVVLIDDFIQKNPSLSFSDQVYFKKGEIYYNIRRYDEAIASYKEFLSAYPNSSLAADAYYWIGKSEQNLNNTEEALYNFNRVFDQYPGTEASVSAAIEIGNIYNTMKNYPAAINTYDKALSRLEHSPKAAELLFSKGTTQINKGDYSAAYETFGQILTYYDGTLFADKAKLELGLIEYSARRYDNADVYFSTLADGRTDDIGAKANYYLGVSYFEQKRYEDAVREFIKIKNTYTSEEWVTRSMLKLGDTYMMLKDNDKAKETFSMVLSRHKGNEFGQEAQKKLREIK